MSFGDETKQYHSQRIREVLVLKPTAVPRVIKETLAAHPQAPLNLDLAYIRKHIAKIRGEQLERYNRPQLARSIAELEDKTESIGVEMWKIMLGEEKYDERARVQAGKAIIEAAHDLLQAKMDAGIFTRRLGEVAVEHTHEHIIRLDPLVKAGIMRAFKNYGIIRSPAAALPAETAGAGTAHAGAV